MLVLSALPTSGVVRLAKAAPKREGAGISWDVDLCMEVSSDLDAQAVDDYLPGAAAAFAAREGSRGTASTSGGFDMMRVLLADVSGEKIAECHAEVRKCSIKVTASQGVLTIGMRLHGLVQEAAMRLAYNLDEQIQVTLRAHATQLSLLAPSEQPEPEPESLVGRLVVHEFDGVGVVSGVVHSQNGSTLEIATLEDPELLVIDLPSRPSSVLEIDAAPGHDLHALLHDYAEKCDSAKIPSSWVDVVQALGELYAAKHKVRSGTRWLLNEAVMERAAEVATAKQAGK